MLVVKPETDHEKCRARDADEGLEYAHHVDLGHQFG